MSSTICVSGREVGAPRFSAYLVIAVLLQVGELLAGAPGILPGQPYPNSALHWPKSAHYDTPPTLITGKALLCPISQARSGSSGYAIVSFTVGVDGKSHDIQILKASYPYFGSHTVLAVRDWKFEPARKNGKPVPVKASLVMPFRGRWG